MNTTSQSPLSDMQYPFPPESYRSARELLLERIQAPATSDADVVKILEGLASVMRCDFRQIIDHLARAAEEIKVVLDWRCGWGQRYAQAVPAYHRARVEASAACLEGLHAQIDAVCSSFKAMELLLQTQVSLERAAELIAGEQF